MQKLPSGSRISLQNGEDLGYRVVPVFVVLGRFRVWGCLGIRSYVARGQILEASNGSRKRTSLAVPLVGLN